MAELYRGIMAKIHDHAPNSSQVLRFAVLVISGAILLSLSGLTAVGLALLTPILIVFSPILLPVGTVLFVAVAGLFGTGLFGLAVFFGFSWLYSYVNGRRPVGSDQIDYARIKIAETACHVKQYATECGGYLQGKLRDAAPGA